MHANRRTLQLLHAIRLGRSWIPGKSFELLLVDVVANEVLHVTFDLRLHDGFELRLHLEVVSQDFFEFCFQRLLSEKFDACLRFYWPLDVGLFHISLERLQFLFYLILPDSVIFDCDFDSFLNYALFAGCSLIIHFKDLLAKQLIVFVKLLDCLLRFLRKD